MTKKNLGNGDLRSKPDKKIGILKVANPRDIQGGAYDTDPGAPTDIPEGLKRERKGPLSPTKGRS